MFRKSPFVVSKLLFRIVQKCFFLMWFHREWKQHSLLVFIDYTETCGVLEREQHLVYNVIVYFNALFTKPVKDFC